MADDIPQEFPRWWLAEPKLSMRKAQLEAMAMRVILGRKAELGYSPDYDCIIRVKIEDHKANKDELFQFINQMRRQRLDQEATNARMKEKALQLKREGKITTWTPELQVYDEHVEISPEMQRVVDALYEAAPIVSIEERMRDRLRRAMIYGIALFRMPFIAAEENSPKAWQWNGRHLIRMRPQVIRTADKPRVGFCRGWRYATASQVPPDLTERQIDEALPADLQEHLDEMGV